MHRPINLAPTSRARIRARTRVLFPAVALLACGFSTTVSAQVVVYPTYRPIVTAPVVAAPVIAAPVIAPTYVSNYVPAGNYAAVTAFSPPVVAEPAAVVVRAAYPPAYAPVATPVTSFYAPAPMAAPIVAAPVVAAPAVVPVTTFYAPAAVAVPMRRGILGGWRPVRTGYAIPY